MKNEEAENTLRQILSKEGYKLSPCKENGETGVDIIAIKIGEELFIEVIGCKKSNPARSRDFFEVFFRAISRIKDGAETCVIALPNQFKVGMPQRFDNYKDAWVRIGNAFPELKIWFIYRTKIEKHNWNEVEIFKTLK